MRKQEKWLSPLEPANLPLSALEGRRGLFGAAAGHPHISRRESRRPREWGALGCLLFILCGPASGGPAGGPWTKPGVGPAEAAHVYAYCRARAEAAFKSERDVDQDILATRGSDWQRAGTLSSERSQMGAEAAGRLAAVIAGCMRAHGFARAG